MGCRGGFWLRIEKRRALPRQRSNVKGPGQLCRASGYLCYWLSVSPSCSAKASSIFLSNYADRCEVVSERLIGANERSFHSEQQIIKLADSGLPF